jgi:hypothetical protein
MKNRLLQLSIGLVTTASLTACGGGNNTGSVPTGQTVSAQFLDAAVSNLHYASFSYAGETNAAGNFTCALNEEVTFSIGALALGSAICQRIVTPQTISATISQVPAPAQTTTTASGVVVSNGSTVQSTVEATVQADAPEVVNRVRLLLTLDTDSDPANGIQLPPLAEQNNVTLTALDFSNAGNSFDNTATTEIIGKMPSVSNRSLVDAVTASAHFNDTLTNIIPSTTATPVSQPSSPPVNIGQYYDDDTGGFDEDSLEAEHSEFDESNEHGAQSEQETGDE